MSEYFYKSIIKPAAVMYNPHNKMLIVAEKDQGSASGYKTWFLYVDSNALYNDGHGPYYCYDHNLTYDVMPFEISSINIESIKDPQYPWPKRDVHYDAKVRTIFLEQDKNKKLIPVRKEEEEIMDFFSSLGISYWGSRTAVDGAEDEFFDGRDFI